MVVFNLISLNSVVQVRPVWELWRRKVPTRWVTHKWLLALELTTDALNCRHLSTRGQLFKLTCHTNRVLWVLFSARSITERKEGSGNVPCLKVLSKDPHHQSLSRVLQRSHSVKIKTWSFGNFQEKKEKDTFPLRQITT